jgi:CheY-like chemotaxis protein
MKSRRRSRLVAIVEDDDSLQRALQDLIESDGLSALCFGSAEQFLESTARHEAACLIADIRMPGMSGLDLQAKLKGERCRIPIIFTTAHGDAEMRTLAMREGAVELLVNLLTMPYCWGSYMPLSIGEEMLKQTHGENAETRYANRFDTGATVWSNAVSEVGDVDKRDVPAVVSAMSRALDRAMQELLTPLPVETARSAVLKKN